MADPNPYRLLQTQDLAIAPISSQQVLVHNLNLEIRPGELWIFRGPNGSGKSTLLKTLLKEISPVRGKVEWRIPPSRIAYLPQLENTEVHLPFTLGDVLKVSTTQKHLEAVSHWGLLETKDLGKAWNTASGGERKRTLLTRALLQNPQVLILDEPFNHLDEASQEKILRALEQFLIESSVDESRAVILVSHQPLSFQRITPKVLTIGDTSRPQLEPAMETSL